MILEYLVPKHSKILYFLKEFILLISYCATAYYFIFQAGTLLFEYTFYRYILYSSLFLTAISLVTIFVYFIANLLVFGESLPCNSIYWVIMRIIGLCLSILSIIISMWIHWKLIKISQKLHLGELKSRMFYLW
jgi:hypothetical protein